MSKTEEGRVTRPGAARVAAAWRSGPLSVPGFRLLTFGQFTSTVGDYCYAVALPWLVLSGGGSAGSLGIVLACYGVPRALLTVPGGSLTDRFSPRLVMLSADFTRCALTALLALSLAYGLTQREFRDFGAEGKTGDKNRDKEELSADKGPSPAGA